METSTYTVPASGLKVDVHLPTKRRPSKLPVLFAVHPGASDISSQPWSTAPISPCQS